MNVEAKAKSKGQSKACASMTQRCERCHNTVETLLDGLCPRCWCGVEYQPHRGEHAPSWLLSLRPLVVQERRLVQVEGVNLQAVRASARRALVKSFELRDGGMVVLVNARRDRLGFIAQTKGLVFWTTLATDKLTPELVISLGIQQMALVATPDNVVPLETRQ